MCIFFRSYIVNLSDVGMEVNNKYVEYVGKYVINGTFLSRYIYGSGTAQATHGNLLIILWYIRFYTLERKMVK